MLPQRFNGLSRTTNVVCLLSMVFLVTSCGHAQAFHPDVPMDVVMKTIHNYGSDHAGLLSPGDTSKPDESDGLYTAHISNLLVQGNFAELEKIAEQNRTRKTRLLGGFWSNHEFFAATSFPSSPNALKDSDFQDQLAMLEKWIAAYPKSAAARLSLAEFYNSYGHFARGTGYANTVSNSQWRLFNERTALAKQTLLEAATLTEKDPYWYYAMQGVAHHEGWSKAEARELLEQAMAFEPGYYHYYRNYADYLLPQWYGEKGDIQAFAEQTSAQLPSPDNSIVYFQIMSSLACYCQESMEGLSHASYQELRDGYLNLSRLYGTSNLTANRFALMAATFHDKFSAHEAFAEVVSRDATVWTTQQSFEFFRAWANAP
jgi:hypothetical protein